MATKPVTFKVDLRGLKGLVKAWRKSQLPRPLPRLWGKRYSAFARRRFAAGGDGTWKPLEPSTLAGRRKAGKGARILRDTGVVFQALEIGAPGNLLKNIPHGVRFGFGGPARHPDGKASIADIGRFHDAGDGVPQRKIIVEPNRATVRGMLSDVKRVNARLLREADAKTRRSRSRLMR